MYRGVVCLAIRRDLRICTIYLWLGERTVRLHTIIAGLYFSEFAIAGWFGSPNGDKLGEDSGDPMPPCLPPQFG